MTKLNLGADIGGKTAYAPKPSTLEYSVTLTSATAASITVPSTSQYYVASFSYQPGSTVWVSFTTTAAIPVGNTLSVTGSELLPSSRTVTAGTVISIITGTGPVDVGISFYEI